MTIFNNNLTLLENLKLDNSANWSILSYSFALSLMVFKSNQTFWVGRQKFRTWSQNSCKGQIKFNSKI